MELLTQLVDYYVNLLIIQYHDKPKAQATIALFINLCWANLILFQIRDGFDWRTAVGIQLDIIGKWVGITRFYDGTFLFLRPWFSLIDWDSTPDNLQGGYSTFENFEELEGGIVEYDTLSPTRNRLDDTAFSMMIGLKIIANSISYTAKAIDEAIYNYFDGDVYTKWQNSTLTYYYKPELREVLQVALFKNVLPAPTGITIDLQEVII